MRCCELPSLISLTVTLLVVALSSAAAQTSENTTRHEIDGTISIEVPSGAALSGPSIGPDFSVFFIMRGGKKILSLYSGNAADFPWKDVEYTRIGKCLALIVTSKVPGLQNGDVLLPLMHGDFRKQIHMFYRDANPDRAAEVRKIIASIRVLEPQTCITEHTERR